MKRLAYLRSYIFSNTILQANGLASLLKYFYPGGLADQPTQFISHESQFRGYDVMCTLLITDVHSKFQKET